MKLGLIVPQGWTGEYDGWAADDAWQRTLHVAQQADAQGIESIWLFDHFHTTPEPTDEITFESFTTLTALGVATRRVRLGHIVSCAGFRNPALVAKMITTMDVITGGRMELGVGAGWKEEEWRAYGYAFPSARDRLRQLEDALEIARRMFGPGRASYGGTFSSVDGAINEPKPLQRPLPIMVGGNGREVTWRLAARYADELNVDAMNPADLREALPVLAQRCEEIGRDPSTLRVSVHIWRKDPERNQREPLPELLEQYRELGVSRVMALLPGIERDDQPLHEYVEAGRAAGAVAASAG
ncbi:MAG TPA: TIGR03560 family F420-dependent LLM class oxidoreductase [Candidatus Limnocylindrales bacterium]|nr:TIGR03560 family F420-dependent LLM class oxidoreductase [Candidatus Limnocylindrales bacterium]